MTVEPKVIAFTDDDNARWELRDHGGGHAALYEILAGGEREVGRTHTRKIGGRVEILAYPKGALLGAVFASPPQAIRHLVREAGGG